LRESRHERHRHRGLTEPAADAAINAARRNLRLPTMRGQFCELADAAARDQMTYRGFLAELLMAECDDRNRRRSERRIKAAGFPREKALRTFEFDANPADAVRCCAGVKTSGGATGSGPRARPHTPVRSPRCSTSRRPDEGEPHFADPAV
jgi:hypothetical protein